MTRRNAWNNTCDLNVIVVVGVVYGDHINNIIGLSLSSTMMMLLAALAYMGFTIGFVAGGCGLRETGLGMLRDIRLGILLTLGRVPVGLTFCLTGGTDTDRGGTDIACGGTDIEVRGVDSGGGGTDISWTVGGLDNSV